MELIEKTVELSLLYDFYGELLKGHKREIFEDYVLNDLSLSEIAENVGITRQGVHDAIKSCTGTLRKYEETLHLLEKYKLLRERCSRIESLLEGDESDNTKEIRLIIEEIKNNGI